MENINLQPDLAPWRPSCASEGKSELPVISACILRISPNGCSFPSEFSQQCNEPYFLDTALSRNQPAINQKCKTTCLTLTKLTITHWIIVKQACEKCICPRPDATSPKPVLAETCAPAMRGGSFRPRLGQIERPVDKGMAVARHIAGEHTDLAIGDRASRPSILPADAARSLALLQDPVSSITSTASVGHGGLQLLEFGRNVADGARAVHDLDHGAVPRHFADILIE